LLRVNHAEFELLCLPLKENIHLLEENQWWTSHIEDNHSLSRVLLEASLKSDFKCVYLDVTLSRNGFSIETQVSRVEKAILGEMRCLKFSNDIAAFIQETTTWSTYCQIAKSRLTISCPEVLVMN
jgi:hypothetical protein